MEDRDAMVDTLIRYTAALSVAFGYRDHLTRLHSDRVSSLAAEIGSLCGLTEREMGILRIAAAFHDVGKIGVSDAVLMKPSRLDQGEWEQMQRHSVIGEEIIRATGLDGAAEAAVAIRHHHEHYDGGGYPDGLAGENIPLLSRIIAIADSYDAMAVPRVYHRARDHAAVMEVLDSETGQKHDPQLMRVFRGMIERSPFRTS